MCQFTKTNPTDTEFTHIRPGPAAQGTSVAVSYGKLLFFVKLHDIRYFRHIMFSPLQTAIPTAQGVLLPTYHPEYL